MTFALHDAIAELATYNDDPAAGGITREVFTPTYERSVDFVYQALAFGIASSLACAVP